MRQCDSNYFGSGLQSYTHNAKIAISDESFFGYENSFTLGQTSIVGSIIPKSYPLFNKPNIYTLFSFFNEQETTSAVKKGLGFEDFLLKTRIKAKVEHPGRVKRIKVRTQPRIMSRKRLISSSILSLHTPSSKKSTIDFTSSVTSTGVTISEFLLPTIYRLALKRRLYSYGGFVVDPNLVQPYSFMNNKPEHSKYTRRSPFRGFLRQSALITKVRKRAKIRRLRFFKRRRLTKSTHLSIKINRFRVVPTSSVFFPTNKTKPFARGTFFSATTALQRSGISNEMGVRHLSTRTNHTFIPSILHTERARGVRQSFFMKLRRLNSHRPYLIVKARLVNKFTFDYSPSFLKKLVNLDTIYNFYNSCSAHEYTFFYKNTVNKALWGTKPNNSFVKPRSLRSYILGCTGFFLVSKVFKPLISFTPRFNKRIYSFLFPNEVKNKLLRKKKKIKYQSAVFRLRSKLKHNKFFSYKNINKNYRNFLLTQSDLKVTKLSYSFATNSKAPLSDFKIGYRDSYDNIVDEEYFYNKGLSSSFKRMEVHIPRIRFRPGYQRIWRQARSAIKESLGLKFIYQQQLTKYMMRFVRKSRSYFLGENVACFDRVIIYSHLLPDMHSISTFHDQSMIHLNGRVRCNLKSLVYKNDFIQLLASVWFYVANRWLDNWTIRRLRRFRRLVFRKNRAHKYTVIKTRKQKSRYTPDWIFDHKFDNLGIRQYLEVDFFTLSAFVVYDPRLNFYSSPDEVLDSRTHIYRMYNWKYIT